MNLALSIHKHMGLIKCRLFCEVCGPRLTETPGLTNTDHDSKKGGARFDPPNNGWPEDKPPQHTGIPRAGSIRHFLTLLLNSHSTLGLRAKRTATPL